MRDLVQSERTLLHGDAHLGNLVEYRGRSALIDLNDPCYAGIFGESTRRLDTEPFPDRY